MQTEQGQELEQGYESQYEYKVFMNSIRSIETKKAYPIYFKESKQKEIKKFHLKNSVKSRRKTQQ